ncbi:uncharacterized protein FOMMEDRAFT_143792 [Fomitiporia mediterranea MF3/22]|uniref:uncharacterized protein n=1 Tax=Fomitiporia mediterranea (strain MF3/22) TaxID=694068 RepID=UPI0004407376|nr:uncharacterized protein FOMMEDRAFT_143792 [Fomitiporia mediterranea MF3/22]EJD07348.1 hypothetical protein FOMMEDRAFT_143792 [Fomitiporia mediterranea MF3/22]
MKRWGRRASMWLMPATRTRRRIPSDGVLPENPNWITIHASDGNAKRWPTNTTMNPDSVDNVDFMQPLPIDDGSSIKWRLVIGKKLAKMLNRPDPESDKWVLKDWPAGYQFYIHKKGHKDDPRCDPYLIGSEIVGRFRSPAEFIPHACWLMTDATRNRSNCACKYCTGKPQREISNTFGLSRIGRLPRNDSYNVKDRPVSVTREENEPLPHRQQQAPEAFNLSVDPTQPVNLEREKDLRAQLGPSSLGERRWAREGELVWVRLDYPIHVDDVDSHSETISFWPGIIDEINIKSNVTLTQTQETRLANASEESPGPTTPSSSDASLDLDPWTVVQKFVYKVELLVTSGSVIYGSDRILPYQSYAPDSSLVAAVRRIKFNLDDSTGTLDRMTVPSDPEGDGQMEQAERALFNRFRSYNPFPENEPRLEQGVELSQYISTAAGAFAVAIQIASRLTMYWTPSDAWEGKMRRPSTRTNAWSLVQETSSFAERCALIQRVLGLLQTSDDGYTAQTRFQGMWWGPERIWTGDIVRLKLGRYEVAPEGTDMIRKPSGARKYDLLEVNMDRLGAQSAAGISDVDSVMHDVDTIVPDIVSFETGGSSVTKSVADICAQNLGAVLRSLFLRIVSLFLVQVPSDDGKSLKNECRMSGMLYELADEDWEPDGAEFREPLSQNTVETDSHSPISSKASMVTPLRAVTSNEARPILADVINQSASRGPRPSSSSLDTPKPGFPTDVVMTDLSQNSSSSSALVGLSLVREQEANWESPVSNVESSVPSASTSTPQKSTERHCPLPPPPLKRKFRPILRDRHEVVMPLTELAGRYYPGLLENPHLWPRLQGAVKNPEAPESKVIGALDGFLPGVYNSVDPTRFLAGREKMLDEAEKIARAEVVDYWKCQTKIANAIVADDD